MPLSYLLAPTLFLGPLYARYLDKSLPGQQFFGPARYGLTEKRNYVVVSFVIVVELTRRAR